MEVEPAVSDWQTEDAYASELEQMEAIWQSLPAEHQVALALRFVDEIMAGDYRPYLQYLWAQQYPLQTQELE